MQEGEAAGTAQQKAPVELCFSLLYWTADQLVFYAGAAAGQEQHRAADVAQQTQCSRPSLTVSIYSSHTLYRVKLHSICAVQKLQKENMEEHSTAAAGSTVEYHPVFGLTVWHWVADCIACGAGAAEGEDGGAAQSS